MKNPIRTIVVAVLLMFVTTSQVSAQKLKGRDFDLSEQDFVDTIKIKMWNGAVIIPVEIEGETRNLMFDTGADWGFWIGKEELWMKPSGDSLTVRDSQNQRFKKAIMKMPPIKLGDITITDYPIIVDERMEVATCGIIDGAFGFDLVEKGISFKFDTQDSLMIMTSRKGFFDKEKKGQPKLKYKLEGDLRPIVKVRFPGKKVKMLFDSGFIGGWISLPQQMLGRWMKEDPILQQKIEEMTVIVDTTLTAQAGLFGVLVDTVLIRLLRIPETQLGDITLKDLWVKTSARQLLVGSSILERASIIIDARKKSFVLLPHDGNRSITVGNKDMGDVSFVLAEEGDTLGAMKAVVLKDYGFYKKGIRTGDYLIAADGIPITDYCTYRLMRYKGKGKHLTFRSPEGEIKEIDLDD